MIETALYPGAVARALADLDVLATHAAHLRAEGAMFAARRQRLQVAIGLAEAEADLARVEAEAIIAGCEGSNAETRKARLTLAVQGTPEFGQVLRYRADLKRADLAAEEAQDCWKSAGRRLYVGAELLHALGG